MKEKIVKHVKTNEQKQNDLHDKYNNAWKRIQEGKNKKEDKK